MSISTPPAHSASPRAAVSPPATSSSGILTWGAFLGCSAIWGSTFLFISIGNDTVPPLWAAALRLGLASIILFVLVRITGHGMPKGAGWRNAIGLGFLNFGLGICLLYWGEKQVPSGLSAVIFGVIPLVTALLTRAFGLEPLRPLKVLGALVALGGIAAIFSGQLEAAVHPTAVGAILLSEILASLSGIVIKLGPRQSAWTTNAGAAPVGFLVCLAGSFLTGEPHAIPTTWAAVFPIVYLTLAGSIGAFVLYVWLVNRWKLTRISFISVLVPVVALALGTLFRHERLTGASIAGTALVFTGLALGLAADRTRR